MFAARSFSPVEKRATAQPGSINRHIVRALFSLVSAALLLRMAGMINQVVVSANFGAGEVMDAYFVAMAFPLLLAQLISSALEAAVIPVYSRLRLSVQQEDVSKMLSTLINSLAICALFLSFLLIFLRQPLVFLVAPGLDAAQMQEAVALAPWFYLALPLSVVISLLDALLNVEGQFGWPAYAGVLVPCINVLVTLVGARVWGIQALCIGALGGTLLQFLVVVWRAKRARLHYRLMIDPGNSELHLICRAAWPVLLGALIIQGGPLVDQIFASTLPAGSISALNYALKLVSVFTGVVVVSVGRVALPHLARLLTPKNANYRAFKRSLHLYVWSIGLGSLLLSGSLLCVAHPLVQLLLQHGAFSASNACVTTLIFYGFIPGLTPMALTFLFSRAFNALGETRVPMYMALVNVGANAFFDAIFAHFWGGLGIALATSGVSLIVCSLLLMLLYRRIGPFSLWRVPSDLRLWCKPFLFSWRRQKLLGSIKEKVHLLNKYIDLRITWLYAGITSTVLVGGMIATARDAIATMRISIGSLVLLSFLRYPFVLLLAWASLDVCIGSSLPIFNGNNLDIVLILPVLILLVFLPWWQKIKHTPGFIWLGCYLIWVFLGIGLSPLTTRAFLTLWLTMLASIGTGALTLVLISTRQRLRWLTDILLGTACLVALYGWYGMLTHQRGEVDAATSLFRVTSLFSQATTFAFYLSSLLPLAFYRCLCTQRIGRLFSIAVTVCLLGALILTFTRSAYLGVWSGVIIMACCLPDRRIRLLAMGSLLVSSATLVYLAWSIHLPWFARFFEEDMSTFNGRLYLWQALLSNFQVTHWFGAGLESSDQLLTYLRVGSSGQGVIGTAPHSLLFGTLYDHGVIGLLFLCLAFCSLGFGLWRGIWRSRGERRILYGAAMACLCGVLVQSLGSRDLWIQAVGTPFWIIMALPFACYWTDKEKAQRSAQGEELSSPVELALMPDLFPLCQIEECAEGEV